MKTSIKLLLGLALALIVAMFGAAISIRRQYDTINKSDPYARWQTKSLPSFHSVQITGPSVAVVQIEPGSVPRLLADSLNDWKRARFTYHVDHDTLFLTLSPVDGSSFDNYVSNEEWYNPQLVIQLPRLQAVSATNALCQVQDFTGTDLTLNQRLNGYMLLKHLAYNQLNATILGRNHLLLYGKRNQIGKGVITARDSSSFRQESDFRDGLTLTADPSVKLELTGKALQQLRQ